LHIPEGIIVNKGGISSADNNRSFQDFSQGVGHDLRMAAYELLFVLLFENPYSVKIVSMPFDKLMLAYVIVTAIAAIAAVVTLLTIRGQLRLMRRQLGQMEEAGKQTESLIAQASMQTNALLIAARAAESNAEAAHAQVTQFRAVAEAAEKSANAAVRNAEALINSERPWIFPKIFADIIGIDTNTEIIVPNSIDFNLINLGRTPGELIAVKCWAHFSNNSRYGYL